MLAFAASGVHKSSKRGEEMLSRSKLHQYLGQSKKSDPGNSDILVAVREQTIIRTMSKTTLDVYMHPCPNAT